MFLIPSSHVLRAASCVLRPASCVLRPAHCVVLRVVYLGSLLEHQPTHPRVIFLYLVVPYHLKLMYHTGKALSCLSLLLLLACVVGVTLGDYSLPINVIPEFDICANGGDSLTCSNHGKCVDGKCVCTGGYTGKVKPYTKTK